ncbi:MULTISPECIES: ANTAR domain-containing response regulator [unclassified Shewanella]|uniref:ANTAR domain-containing response regulator n=1 Tax=unclassified Shewanella TaxID=196818 RepID=UPI001BC6D69A|nr:MULTISPECIES: ANTAR domain-containing protein [unclassified Shewanella]GIU07894.1 hypothetical protein TUM4444_08060 [Shewanella sp. MBTL60-112-B1]GIU30559.1 hypothetical protein TUM4445_14040 [Shewanella sp. MBTL60-112-B2]
MRILMVAHQAEREQRNNGEMKLEAENSKALERAVNTADHQYLQLADLSRLETIPLDPEADLLLLSVAKFSEVHLRFIMRLMGFSPIPVIVTAEQINQQTLMTLIGCGRITYAPQCISPARVNSVIELALTRFQCANQALLTLKHLREELAEQKFVYLAKSKLQQAGLTEAQAHLKLQKLAMQNGQSLANAAKVLCG